MTNKGDKAEQALGELLKTIRDWNNAYDGPANHMGPYNRGLQRAFRKWEDASEPPRDPHKEWVDAEKMKPNSMLQPVLVKTSGNKIGLAEWTSICSFDGVKSWQVQLFMECWYRTKEGVTHWRYLPLDKE